MGNKGSNLECNSHSYTFMVVTERNSIPNSMTQWRTYSLWPLLSLSFHGDVFSYTPRNVLGTGDTEESKKLGYSPS